MLSVDEFAAFFSAVHDGAQPYRWQVELLKSVVATGRWPEQIAAPTGSGKSAVVEVHVFANALAACGAGERPPRRMAVVVNRRALTDAHADRVNHIQDLLEVAPDDGGVLARVREALARLRPESESGAPVLVAATMRGAAVGDRGWLQAPEACAVLCMTPAMWGSSLLFRSYGSSVMARPRLAGLLALDAVVVVDEAHLSRQLVVTGRRVGELTRNSSDALGVPSLQVVEMTATPTDQAVRTAGVTRSGLEDDAALASRAQAPKSVSYVATDAWPSNGTMSKAYCSAVVDQVLAQVKAVEAAGDAGPRTVGCVLNRVRSAVEVAAELRARGLRCAVWVGRMREWDLAEMRRTNPGLFTPLGDATIDVLVANQTVEVGVDLDLAGLVTELASGSALAQRAGRVNRMGLRSKAPVVVLGPDQGTSITKDVEPYRANDLEAARAWVRAREESGDLSPIAVAEQPPSPETPRRRLWQRPEVWDVSLWSRTSQQLFADPELDLWLQDDLSVETEPAGVVVRRLDDLADAASCESLVAVVPPIAAEVYPARIVTLRRLVQTWSEAPERPLERSVLWRAGEPVAEWQAIVDQGGTAPARQVRPGDILVVDESLEFLTEGIAVPGGSETGAAVPWTAHLDVVAVVTDREILSPLSSLTPDAMAEVLGGEVELPASWDEAAGPAWAVIRRGRVVDAESEERSMTSSAGPVTLAEHNAAVASRSREITEAIGLAAEASRLVDTAARWHDVGKEDARFQRMLGASEGAGAQRLAKSGARGRRSTWRAWADSGLPSGWRHELASAAAYWEATASGDGSSQDRDLVTRLVGTSHGRGRPTFDYGAAVAGPQHAEALAELLDDGEWESVIARTDRRWGPWGTAYLEAVLRAADTTVSSEGR